MKKVKALLVILIVFFGCEDVVEVAVPEEKPRLIIDGLTRVDLDAPTTVVRIKAKLTSSFFGTIPLTGLDEVYFGNIGEGRYEGGVGFMRENPIGSGVYESEVSTESLTSGRLVIQLSHDGRLYVALTRFAPAVAIDKIEQGTNTLFNGDETEVIVTFTDNPDQNNFYIFDFDFDFDEFLVTDDEFYQGQEFKFSYFYDRQLKPSTTVKISILGADRAFYNYMDQLIEQSGPLQGPFQTPVATVRGNVFDVTDLDNRDVFDNVEQPNVFPLGYFAVVQVFTDSITIQ